MAEHIAATALRALQAQEVSQRDALRLARVVLKLQAERAVLQRRTVADGQKIAALHLELAGVRADRDALRERFGQAVAAAVEEARLTDQETIAKLEFRLGHLGEAEHADPSRSTP